MKLHDIPVNAVSREESATFDRKTIDYIQRASASVSRRPPGSGSTSITVPVEFSAELIDSLARHGFFQDQVPRPALWWIPPHWMSSRRR